MTYPRCAELDVLRNDLIEAYREMNTTEISAVWGSNYDPSNSRVSELIGNIRDHTSSCILCQRILGAQREAAAIDRKNYRKSA
jgi:hypothetical protein